MTVSKLIGYLRQFERNGQGLCEVKLWLPGSRIILSDHIGFTGIDNTQGKTIVFFEGNVEDGSVLS